tara:strand:- start:152 stop:553 length:402 start_codon:yes stop_codon:yes gene_type:complete
MQKEETDIIKLKDLNNLRTAPQINKEQSMKILKEAKHIISKSDWLTIGVMSPTTEKGIQTIRDIEKKFNLNKMKCINLPNINGPSFIKANQKTGEIHARIEHGLGEGVLISCHNNDESKAGETLGPFPLDFFN